MEYAQFKAVVASTTTCLRGWKNDLYSPLLWVHLVLCCHFQTGLVSPRAGINVGDSWVST